MANQIRQQEQKFNIGEFLLAQKKQIEAALPKHLTSDRMLRIVMTEIRKTPKLKECTPASLIGAVIQCSQLGLEPGGALGHAYLIPYGKECQFIVGYRGMIELARRSGLVIAVSAHPFYEKDLFEFEYGTNEYLKHKPYKGDRGEFFGSYAIAKLATPSRKLFDGSTGELLNNESYQFEVMYKEDIEKVRKRSKAANNGPWVTDYEEMSKKCPVRRLFKYLPTSVEMQKAIIADEAADRGEQNNGLIIEAELGTQDMNGPANNTPTFTKADRLAEKMESETAEDHEQFIKEME